VTENPSTHLFQPKVKRRRTTNPYQTKMNSRGRTKALVGLILYLTTSSDGFSSDFVPTRKAVLNNRKSSSIPRYLSDNPNERELKFARTKIENTVNLDEEDSAAFEDRAATKTVNERLMAELKEAENKEKFGARSSVGKKLGLDGFGRSRKTDEEIQAALAEARDLNGVNPVVAITGSLFALGVAAGLWYGTKELGTFFALHPVESDVYFVQRSAQVVRNVAMGMISLAAGFFGVTGLGIFLLGVRVAYGIVTGELDPTPIKQNQQEKVDVPNVWDLMMNKKPGRRGGGKGGRK
jgi:hypothetical protein